MRKGFTMIELLVVVVAVVVILLVLLPMPGKAKKGANIMAESVHARNIGAAMNVYADSNKGYFPAHKQARIPFFQIAQVAGFVIPTNDVARVVFPRYLTQRIKEEIQSLRPSYACYHGDLEAVP